MAQRKDQPEPVLLGHRMLGLTKLFSGELSESLEHLEIATDTKIPQTERSAPFLYGQDIEAAARCLYALALSYRG
ncbi:hypothetical protein RUA4292_02942 [Ruegeria atlantica]|uniref:Uncharacterized protein n=1 Tax=Ruegeria atlantica TaxID=81569 RepID=A0A0P1F447_9RHOB|nr:hypothetical protein RUA4292_02942 [Ruegeria atlantica]